MQLSVDVFSFPSGGEATIVFLIIQYIKEKLQ